MVGVEFSPTFKGSTRNGFVSELSCATMMRTLGGQLVLLRFMTAVGLARSIWTSFIKNNKWILQLFLHMKIVVWFVYVDLSRARRHVLLLKTFIRLLGFMLWYVIITFINFSTLSGKKETSFNVSEHFKKASTNLICCDEASTKFVYYLGISQLKPFLCSGRVICWSLVLYSRSVAWPAGHD